MGLSVFTHLGSFWNEIPLIVVKYITNGQKNFLEKISKQNKLTEHIIKSEEVTLDTISFNPTSLNQVLQVINYELENKNLFGVFNLSNKGFTTHYEYGCYINNLMGGKKKINQVSEIKRDFTNYGKFLMSTDKLEQFCKLTSWEDDMKNYVDSLLKHKKSI